MARYARIDKIAAEQGWSDHTLFELAVSFMEDEDSVNDFINFLCDVQAEENAEFNDDDEEEL